MVVGHVHAWAHDGRTGEESIVLEPPETIERLDAEEVRDLIEALRDPALSPGRGEKPGNDYGKS